MSDTDAGFGFVWPISDEDKAEAAVLLKDTLDEIERYDRYDYDARNLLVVLAVGMALTAGLEAGFEADKAEPGWPVAYIELPTGQVAWHLSAHKTAWDGHTTEEKYDRIRRYVDGDGEQDGT